MKKIASKLMVAGMLLLCCLHTEVHAQLSDSIYQKMTTVFQHVETARITTGFLKDYGIDFANVTNFDGTELSDSNMVYSNVWDDLYQSLFTYRFNSTQSSMLTPDSVFNLERAALSNSYVPLSLLLMKYETFSPTAVTDGKVTVTSNQIYDKYVSAVWQNPYLQKNVFAVSCNQLVLNQLSLTFRLPAQLLFTNYTNIQSIQGDFADGQGFRGITTGTDISVNYADTGVKVINFRVTLATGQVLSSRSSVGVYYSPASNGGVFSRTSNSTQPTNINNIINIAGTSAHSGGQLQIHYSTANQTSHTITKPLIIVEGFDPWKLQSNDPKDNMNLDVFMSGNFGNTFYSLMTGSYDIIYLDYNDGTDDIVRNAALLTDAINNINALKSQAGSTQQNVLIGFSMGGLVSRYALKKMEQNSVAHQTRLFVSYDAPYLGANIPLGMQALNSHLAGVKIKIGIPGLPSIQIGTLGHYTKALQIYSTTAAQQLLYYYVKNNNGTLTMDNTVNRAFVQTLHTLGYPQNSRNVTVSNGSECALLNSIVPGTDLLRMTGSYNSTFMGEFILNGVLGSFGALSNYPTFIQASAVPGRNDITCSFNVKTTPASGTLQLYSGKLTYTKNIFNLLKISTTISANSYTSVSGTLALDNVPGGQYNVNTVAETVKKNFNNDFGSSFWQQYENTLAKRGITDYYLAATTFTFTPTPHVLDLGDGATTLVNADYLLKYEASAPPASPKNTPFLNFVTGMPNFYGNRTNEDHIEPTVKDGNWLAKELNATPQVLNCGAYCGAGISGPAVICTSGTYTVANVPAGAVTSWDFNQTADVNNPDISVVANGNSASVTRIKNGNVTLAAHISSDCGTTILNYPITVGPLPAPTIIEATIDQFSGCYVSVSPNGTGATSYKFYEGDANHIKRLVLESTNSAAYLPNITYVCGASYYYDIWVESESSCGSSAQSQVRLYSLPCGQEDLVFNVSPNPSSDVIKISKATVNSNMQLKTVSTVAKNPVENINAITITDMKGAVRKNYYFKEGVEQLSVNVSDLQAGIYILSIQYGRKSISKKVVIQPSAGNVK